MRNRITARFRFAFFAFLFTTPTMFGQTFSPYSDFQQMTLADMTTLQVKLTYVGPQKDVIPSVGFTSSSNTFNLAIFVPFRRADISYANDDFALHTFSASTSELKAVIDGVAALSDVTAGGVTTPEFLSFALSNTVGGVKVFEAVLNKPQASAVFDKLRAALANNKTGLREVAGMACPLVILEPGSPNDVTSGTHVTFGGFRLDRSTGRFVGTVTVNNTSGAGIGGPVTLVLDFAGSIRLFNLDGTTCGITPAGREYVNLTLTGNTFPAGASVQIPLQVVNPNSEPIKATTTVWAGSGAR